MSRHAIPYKDTKAMPGSELHRLLSEGKKKEAEESYQATERRAKALIEDKPQPTKSKA